MPTQRIPVSGDAYVFVEAPVASAPGVDFASALRARFPGEAGRMPQVVTWDLKVHARLGEAVVRLGDGPLDDLLLSQFDASAGVAILESMLERLRARSAIRKVDQIGDALAVLARDPRLHVAALPGFVSARAAESGQLKPKKLRPAAHAALTSVAVLVRGDIRRLPQLLDMLDDQRVSGRLEILVIASGLEPDDAASLSAMLDGRRKTGGQTRTRSFVLAGEMSDVILANTAVSLAAGQVVVLIDSRCAPGEPDTVQSLAAWAAGAETLTASPRLLNGAADQLTAGLTLADTNSGGGAAGAWTSPALCELVRRTAAPAPWVFAANRAAWLARSGAHTSRASLWTAALAEAQEGGGAEGRHLLIGSATAVWLQPEPPPALLELAPVARPAAEASRAARLVDAGRAVAQAVRSPRPTQSSSASFTDPFPSKAPLRLLVFADGYGASQSICFVEGLAGRRNASTAAVRVVEEAAFGQDGPTFDPSHADALIDEHLEAVRPTAVVVSRFGHAGAYNAIMRAAAAAGLPLVLHLDDDLFSLPACVGIERYRIARHPWRSHTLYRALEDADLILAATDALARRLARLADASRIVSLEPGTAGAARPRAHQPRPPSGPVVVGYMGSASHNHDLEMLAPALNRLSSRFETFRLELFGSIADQPAADLIKGEVRRLKPVTGDYWTFKRALGELGWDIGLAPLRPIPYNLCKTPTKWAEYAEAGIATVVSDVEVYREMIRREAAVPARPDEWETAIGRLVGSPRLRTRLMENADQLLTEQFGWSALEARLSDAFARLHRPRMAAE